MKKRRHNPRASKAGIDPRAIEQAAELLVRAIAQAMQAQRQPRQALPKKQKSQRTDWSGVSARRAARRSLILAEHAVAGIGERAKQQSRRGVASIAPTPTPAPATREEAVKIAARLITLSRACSDLTLPLEIAAAWLPLADLAAFADRAEEHVRGLLALLDAYLAAHPGALKERGLKSSGFITSGELDAARKELARLSRIADGSIGLNIGPNYLPPECRPSGYVEKPPDDGEILDEFEGDDSPL